MAIPRGGIAKWIVGEGYGITDRDRQVDWRLVEEDGMDGLRRARGWVEGR